MATEIQSPAFKATDQIKVEILVQPRRGTAELGGALSWLFQSKGLKLSGPIAKVEGFVVGPSGAPTELNLGTVAAGADAALGSGAGGLGLLAAICLRSRSSNSASFNVYHGGAFPWTGSPFGAAPGGAFLPGNEAIFLAGQDVNLSGWVFNNAARTLLFESTDATQPLVDLYFATTPLLLP